MTDDADSATLLAERFVQDTLAGIGFGSTPEAATLKQKLLETETRDRAMAAKVAALFSTPKGMEVLDWLVANTLRKGEVPVDLLLTTPPDQIMAHAMMRAGENAVVDMILQAIAQAENKPRRRRKTA